MYLDLRAFFRYNFKAFFKARGKNYRLTPKRFLVLFIWLVLYIPAQIINRFFFLLDELLFFKYHKQPITQPVFIIGNPRSGTTFLHRLMDKDEGTFSSFIVWELIFAPSITQRKLVWAVGKIARFLGAPVQKVRQRINRNLAKGSKAHAIKIDAAEEDDHILIHAWSSATLWPLYPIEEELMPYFFFDRDIPPNQRIKVMAFYRNMLQRHLYAHGGKCRLLSKNPAHTAKLASLLATFPDARFINLVRNPFESLPSMMDYMALGWKFLCDPLEEYPHKERFFEVMTYYYRYPVEFFNGQPDRCMTVKYEDLVSDPGEIVEDIYDWLGMEMSPSFIDIVNAEVEKAAGYQSEHDYSTERMGINKAQIFETFQEVFSFYEFDTLDYELPDHVMFWQIKKWGKGWKERRQLRRARRKDRKTIRITRRQSKRSTRRTRKKG